MAVSLPIKDGNGSARTLRTQQVGSDLVSVNRIEAVPLFQDFQGTLPNGNEIDTGFLDFDNVANYQIIYKGDTAALTLVQESYDNASQTVLSNTASYTASPLFQATFPARQRFIRFRLQNNSGSAIGSVSLEIKSFYGSPTGASVFPLSSQPQEFSSALLTQSVITGKDTDDIYRNVAINKGGALLIADFGTDVALGKVESYNINTKFGRNADIDTGTTPEDVWNGGGDYTGFDCVAAETLSIASDSTQDAGSLVSSGTATGGSSTTIEDTGATFITDGVSVGDMVINDTQLFHGFVSAVTSETELTVYRFKNSDPLATYIPASGDSYRVATSSGTGAAVIRLNAALDANYNNIAEYVIMNGTTPVLTTKSYLRQARAVVEMSGSSDNIVGEITARQSVTTANITMVMPADSGQTAICCSTVPAGKVWVVKQLQAQMTRSSGSLGSAQTQFQVRERGGSWQTKRFEGITSGLSYTEKVEGGIIVEEQSDVRWRVQSVSDNNTAVTALFEYFEIDK